MRRFSQPRFAALALVLLVAGLLAEVTEPGILLQDLGVLAIVGSLATLASILPALLTGTDER